VMCKARPKALKPGLPSPRSLARAEPWSGLGRAQGSAHYFGSLSRAQKPGLCSSDSVATLSIVAHHLHPTPHLLEAPATQQQAIAYCLAYRSCTDNGGSEEGLQSLVAAPWALKLLMCLWPQASDERRKVKLGREVVR
jgi:hypothetical protein